MYATDSIEGAMVQLLDMNKLARFDAAANAERNIDVLLRITPRLHNCDGRKLAKPILAGNVQLYLWKMHYRQLSAGVIAPKKGRTGLQSTHLQLHA